MQVHPVAELPATLGSVEFAVVDVETSRLSSRSHRILQVAVVRALADGTVLDRWCSYVRPRWGWFSRMGPTHIHGIRRRDVRRAPTSEAVLTELGRRIDGAVLTAHNLRFDWGFLASAAARAGRGLPAGPRLCTLQLARAPYPAPADRPPGTPTDGTPDVTPGRMVDALVDTPVDAPADAPRPSFRLGDLCASYGVPLVNAHDALADAEATAALLPHLLRAAGITSSEQLAQFVER